MEQHSWSIDGSPKTKTEPLHYFKAQEEEEELGTTKHSKLRRQLRDSLWKCKTKVNKTVFLVGQWL